uniref:Uncharacterized protein n=1 Tax=Timema tahoe TaxID=61484 RepID=A0A7R9IED0_9NEOP|nr:unnamed protein product [Timema tahoe]
MDQQENFRRHAIDIALNAEGLYNEIRELCDHSGYCGFGCSPEELKEQIVDLEEDLIDFVCLCEMDVFVPLPPFYFTQHLFDISSRELTSLLVDYTRQRFEPQSPILLREYAHPKLSTAALPYQ